MTRDCTLLDLWLDTAHSLTIMQAARVLSKLRQGYTQNHVHIILGAAHTRGTFAFVAAYELSKYSRWYNVRCKFLGGPEGRTEIAGKLGMFVADRFMREVAEGREHLVWDAYREIHVEDSDDERVRIRV